jgi:hypothetical protein
VTNAQANAVLDLYDQCIEVAQAYEQQETHRRFGHEAFEKTEFKKVAEKISKAYDEKVEQLTELYCEAEAIHVSTELLDNLIGLMLPDCDLTKALAT